MNKPRFEIRWSDNKQYYFVLKAENGEIICTSEMYISKQSAIRGVHSVCDNAPIARIIDKTIS